MNELIVALLVVTIALTLGVLIAGIYSHRRLVRIVRMAELHTPPERDVFTDSVDIPKNVDALILPDLPSDEKSRQREAWLAFERD